MKGKNVLFRHSKETPNNEVVLKMETILLDLQTLLKTSAECNEEVSRLVREEREEDNDTFDNVSTLA